MSLTDQTLYCRDCNQEFIFTTGEQEFYASRGFANAPTRCPECRAARKQSNREQRGSLGRGSGGSHQRDTYEIYSTTCASCGQEALVPFQPREGQAVYCSDCYQSQRHTSGQRSRRSFS